MGWRRLVALAMVVTGTLAWAGPAAADGGVRLSGTAGWSRQCRPGRAVLVRARIAADRLVSGILSAEVVGPPSPTIEVAVEVAGGTEEEVTLAVPSPFGCSGLTLRLREGGSTTTALVETSDAGDTVLLGLLPGARRPGPLPSSVVARTGAAAVAALEPELLGMPGAVAGLDSIGATAGDLDGLAPEQAQALTAWVAAGGTLLVDTDRPEELGRLPESWRPAAGGRAEAGRGQVSLTGTALRDGKLDGLAEPSAVAGRDASTLGFDPSGGGIQNSLRRRSGVQVLALPVIVAALALYVVLVGPGARIGLRRLGRLHLTWLVVPVAALTFSGLAVAGGDLLRRGGKPTHLTFIDTDASATFARTFVGVPTRSKGDVTAILPTGWMAGGMGFDTSSGRGAVRITPTGQSLSVPGIPGGFVMLGAQGPAPVPGRLVVDLGRDTGQATVRNELPVALQEVAILAPGGAVTVGRIEAGATVPVTVPSADAPADPHFMARQVWHETGDSLASADVFAMLTAADPTAFGATIAAGWTDEPAAPLALRGGRPSGTTLVLGRAPASPSTGAQVSSSGAMVTMRFVVPPEVPHRLEWDASQIGVPFNAVGAEFDGMTAEVLIAGRWTSLRRGQLLPPAASADGVVYLRAPSFQPVRPRLAAP